MARGAHESGDDVGDRELAELLRTDFTQSISKIARTDVAHVTPDTTLAKLVTTSVDHELQVLPICDEARRIKGLVNADDLLRGRAARGDGPRRRGSGMSQDVTAASLMVRDFAVIGADRTVRQAMWTLVETQADPAFPNALVVVDQEGNYLGLLTARLLLKSLLSLWMPPKSLRTDEVALERELLAAARDRCDLRVQDTLIRGLPVAQPEDRLLSLIRSSCEARLEFTPVVDHGRAIGLVPITEIFNAASSLALTPEDEGIQVEA